MYVAATRAEDHLLVSMYDKAPPRASESTVGKHAVGISGAQRIGASIRQDTRHQDGKALISERPVVEAVKEDRDRAALWEEPPDTEDGSSPPSLVGLTEAWTAERRRLLDASRRTPMHSATSIAGLDPEFDSLHQAAASGSPWRRGRTGRPIGRAVHGVLQMIDLETKSGLDHLCAEQAIAEGIADRSREIELRVVSALESDSVVEAVDSGEYWREVFVGAMVDESAGIEGFIDLLFRSKEGLVVVDYKTDPIEDASELDALMEKYAYQGAAYAVAVNEATGQSVSSVRFVFAAEGKAIERRIDNLREEATKVRELVLDRADL